MIIPTLTANPVHFGRALRRMRHRELVREQRSLRWRLFRRWLRHRCAPLTGLFH